MYPDLAAAFGNNWDAYLTHYLAFGAKEGRDTGTDFNALDYAGRYEDLQEAYGNNILALWKHYQAFGAGEGRESRSEEVVEAERRAEQEAQRKAEEVQKPENPQEPSVSGAHTERVELGNGMWRIDEYNEAGNMVKATNYNADGSVRN